MRILYDHQATSMQDAGGISVYYYQLIQALLSHEDIHITLLAGKNDSVVPFGSLAKANCRIASFRTRVRPGFIRYAMNDLIVSGLGAVAGTFDIYHPTLYRCLPLLRANAIVVTHHDCILELFPQMFKHVAARRQVKRRQFAQADAIICVSENSRNDLLRFYDIPQEKTHVIHLGVTELPIGTLPAGLHIGIPYLLHVGARNQRKNFEVLVKAFARSRIQSDVDLVFAGGGEYTQEEASLIEREGLGKKVILFPRVSNEQLGALYRAAHAFVYPSIYEGFGLPPVEAMACGTVPVVSGVSAMPEICGDGAIYFDPYSAESMMESLECACYDETTRNRIREAGRVVAARYTWEECARKTLQVYRDL